ncbi:MAG: stage III sporulation protein AF [Lachnospiraceae bacterium]|nr:stage III sporulation protein AF [Lachnospiraceae bacterium]
MRGETMSGIYEWVRSLVFYLILMTMVINLLPDKKYEKYLRLFTGMIFLMLVFAPFADLTGIEAEMAERFEKLTFQNDAKLLKREIEDADGRRMAQLIASYEEAVETDMRMMAEGMDVRCLEVEVVLDESLEGGTFGDVLAVNIRMSDDMAAVEAASGRASAELKKKIGEYYGLKESDITIHLEDE